MKRPLIWIIAGCATLAVAVPTIAAARDAGTPDDNGVPGEVRGNCDEAEHASDPACVSVVVLAPTPSVTLPSSSVPSSSTPSVTVPSSSVPSSSTPSVTVPSSSVPDDISGPCDEAEHANDPRCTGAAVPVPDDDDVDDVDDDRSGHRDDDGDHDDDHIDDDDDDHDDFDDDFDDDSDDDSDDDDDDDDSDDDSDDD